MKNKKYIKSNGIIYFCRYHVVWCPKYRRKILIGEIETRIREVIEKTCAETEGVDLIKLEINPDHIHLQLEVNPSPGIHKVVKAIKAETSTLRKEIPEIKRKLPTLWTNAYLVSNADELTVEDMEDFIFSQTNTWRK